VQQVFAYPAIGGSVAYSGTVSDHAHALITNNVQRLWISNIGNVGIGTNAPVNKFEVISNNSGYTGGIIARNEENQCALSIIPLGTNHGVAQWANSSVVFEGVPAASGNTIIGSYFNDLVFQTKERTQRMRLLADGTLIHNGYLLPSSPGAIGSISFVPGTSASNPIFNRIVFGADGSGYGLALASQHKDTGTVTDRLVIYDNGRIDIPGASASTSTTTGALTVAGGVGINGALTVGGMVRISSNNTTALQVSGGARFEGPLVTTKTLAVSNLSSMTRLSVHSDLSVDVNNEYRISARASDATTSAILGYANKSDNSIWGALGYKDAYAFYGNGGITATGSITPGTCPNGSAAKSYILTTAPTTTSMPVSGSVAYIV
jgi:hypothetical protein